MTHVDAMTARLAAGDTKEQAATFAYTTLAFPMLTGSFVTMAGFVPIGFAASAAGEYTFSIFAVVSIALIVSWFVAVLFAPLLGVALLRRRSRRGGRARRAMRSFGGCCRRHAGAMDHHPVTLACFVLAVLAFSHVPRQFFPPSDRPELLVDLRLPQNASIYASERSLGQSRCIFADDPDVERWSTYVGRGAIRFYLPLNVSSQRLLQPVRDRGQGRRRPRTASRTLERCCRRISRHRRGLRPLELGPPVGWPVQYRVSGPDPTEVRAIALRLAQTVATDSRRPTD